MIKIIISVVFSILKSFIQLYTNIRLVSKDTINIIELSPRNATPMNENGIYVLKMIILTYKV